MDEAVFDWIKMKPGVDKPASAEEFDLSKLTPHDWELLASRCGTGYDWSELLQLKPEFADKRK